MRVPTIFSTLLCCAFIGSLSLVGHVADAQSAPSPRGVGLRVSRKLKLPRQRAIAISPRMGLSRALPEGLGKPLRPSADERAKEKKADSLAIAGGRLTLEKVCPDPKKKVVALYGECDEVVRFDDVRSAAEEEPLDFFRGNSMPRGTCLWTRP